MKANFVIQMELLALSLFIPSSAYMANGQGTFQNLGFEAAVIPPPGDPAIVDFAAAFSGWTGYLDGIQASTARYNLLSLGSANIALIGPGSGLPDYILAGQYSAVLQASGGGADASLAQVGVVPATAQLLEFRARIDGLSVSFAGQALPFSEIGTGPNYTLYAADISTFAGQSGELRFTAEPVGEHPTVNVLDSIRFSVVPEPSVTAVLTLASLLLGLGIWGKRRRMSAGGRFLRR